MSNVSDEDPREVVRRMLYEENGPVEFKLYSAVSVFGDITIIMLVVCVCVCVCGTGEVRAAPSAVLKLMTSYVAFAVIGLFVMLIFVDNVTSKSDRVTKPRLKVLYHYPPRQH